MLELQAKTVNPSTVVQTVKPDIGYDGLSQVTVSKVNLQSKTVSPATSAQTVRPDSGYLGLSQVNVGAAPLQEKTVSPSNVVQTVWPDSGYYGLSKVNVNRFDSVLRSITKEQDITTGGGNIVFSFPEFTKLIGVTWYHVVRQDWWMNVVTSDINIYYDEKKIVVTVASNGSGVFYHAHITAIGY